MTRRLTIAAAIACAVALSGCGSPTTYTQTKGVALPLPARPGYTVDAKKIQMEGGPSLYYGRESHPQKRSYAYLAVEFWPLESSDVRIERIQVADGKAHAISSVKIASRDGRMAERVIVALDSNGKLSYYTLSSDGEVSLRWCRPVAGDDTLRDFALSDHENSYPVYALTGPDYSVANRVLKLDAETGATMGEVWLTQRLSSVGAFLPTLKGVLVGGDNFEGQPEVLAVQPIAKKQRSLVPNQTKWQSELAQNSVTSLSQVENLILAGTDKGHVLLIDEKGGTPIVMRPSRQPIKAVTVNGKLLAAVAEDRIRFMALAPTEKAPNDIALTSNHSEFARFWFHGDGSALEYRNADGTGHTVPVR